MAGTNNIRNGRAPQKPGGGASSFSDLSGEASVGQLANDAKAYLASVVDATTLPASRVIYIQNDAGVGVSIGIPSAASCGNGARLRVFGANALDAVSGVDLTPTAGTIGGGAIASVSPGVSGGIIEYTEWVAIGADWVRCGGFAFDSILTVPDASVGGTSNGDILTITDNGQPRGYQWQTPT